MRFTFAAIALAAVAAAMPQQANQAQQLQSQQLPGLAVMTPQQAAGYCGTGLELNCCNKDGVPQTVGTTQPQRPGLLTPIIQGLLGSDGLGGLLHLGDCARIEVGGIPGAGALLNDQCRGKVACCDRTQSVASSSLISISLPCIALGSIVG